MHFPNLCSLQEGNASDFRELLNNTKQFLLQHAKELKRALDISDKKKKDELTKIFVEQNEKLIRSLVETSKKIEEQVGDTFMRKCTLKVCMYANESAECIASLEEIFGL